MTQSLSTQDPSTPVDNPPWYRLPIVWMVIGGPAVVVVAAAAVGKGLATASRPSPARAIRRECFMEGG